MRGIRRYFPALLIIFLAACAPSGSPGLPTEHPTPTTVYQTAESGSPDADVPLTPVRPTPVPCEPVENSRPRYNLSAVIDLMEHTVMAGQEVTYYNETGGPLDEIVFAVEPNRQPGVFSLTRVTLEGADGAPEYTLTGPRLTVHLPEPLGEHCRVDMRLDFVLAPLPIATDRGRLGRYGILGFSDRQFNLGHWLPIIAAYKPGNGWYMPDSYPLGEYYVLEAADFSADVTVVNAEHPILIGPGEVTYDGGTRWHFELPAGRDFTLSVGEDYQLVGASTDDGIGVEVYYFDDPWEANEQNAALHALHVGVLAMERYQSLFGDYPYDRVAIVLADFPDGMEFTGLVFVGSEYFHWYNNNADSWLTLITAHELSHQWWYSIVGNDQAYDPWMDESLATYSESLFMEAAYPELVRWWWDFRVNTYHPEGPVNAPIYEFRNRRAYINATYLRGALMLRDLRAVMGDEAFFEWLRRYVAENAGRIASPDDLWDAMPDGVEMEAVQTVLGQYFE